MVEDLDEGVGDRRQDHLLESIFYFSVGVELRGVGEMGPVDLRDDWSVGSYRMNWVFTWIDRNDKRFISECEVCGWLHHKGKISVLAASS
jgi:hypothetical protein